ARRATPGTSGTGRRGRRRLRPARRRRRRRARKATGGAGGSPELPGLLRGGSREVPGDPLAGGVEAGHDRPDADRLHVGDLGVAQAADLPEPQGLPQRHRQLAQQAERALGLDAGHDDVLHLGGGGRVDLPQRLRRAGAALAPAAVEGAVADDPEGPGVEPLGVGPAPGPPDAEPGLLAGVLRLPRADDGGRVAQGVPRPAGVELLETAAAQGRVQLEDGHRPPIVPFIELWFYAPLWFLSQETGTKRTNLRRLRPATKA